MKNSEIKALSVEEITQKLASETELLQKMKFAHAISPVENPIKIKESKKMIARLKTELRAKEMAK